MKKGSFVVMKTGTHPFIAKLRLHFEWGVTFDEPVYVIEEKSRQKMRYIQKEALRTKILLENSKIGSAEFEEENQRGGKDGKAWPSVKAIAGDLGFSESTVRRGIRELQEKKFITVCAAYRENGGRTNNQYFL